VSFRLLDYVGEWKLIHCSKIINSNYKRYSIYSDIFAYFSIVVSNYNIIDYKLLNSVK